MSVKHTVTITRQEAELRCAQFLQLLLVSLPTMPNRELEDLLTNLNDMDNHGEGFENYDIREV